MIGRVQLPHKHTTITTVSVVMMVTPTFAWQRQVEEGWRSGEKCFSRVFGLWCHDSWVIEQPAMRLAADVAFGWDRDSRFNLPKANAAPSCLQYPCRRTRSLPRIHDLIKLQKSVCTFHHHLALLVLFAIWQRKDDASDRCKACWNRRERKSIMTETFLKSACTPKFSMPRALKIAVAAPVCISKRRQL